jgi:hypothetical protein
MKHFFIKSLMTATVVASAITLSSFKSVKSESKTTVDSYQIQRLGTDMIGTNQVWTWKLTNTNPGNGNNGTLQNVSHWSIPLSAIGEAAFVSAEYSFDGITWFTLDIEIERDPAIRQCCSSDVLKFNVGTTGSAPTYYRATFSEEFTINPMATSWIKTGGGLQGCNLYFFEGPNAPANRLND